ncbi:MAG: hypothetical protein KGJ90_04915 [Patescibacteria group bacterium]|nr:hypothetical protein [Patescibacteria group bacterium]
MKKNDRAKAIEKAVKIVYDSLQSHLPYTHKKSSEGVRFHKQCVKDYTELIKLIISLY